MSAQFFGRSGKVLYGAFSIVGMAYQSQNVNNGIPDDRVARSSSDVAFPLSHKKLVAVCLYIARVGDGLQNISS